jgi:hypothetical protein
MVILSRKNINSKLNLIKVLMLHRIYLQKTFMYIFAHTHVHVYIYIYIYIYIYV